MAGHVSCLPSADLCTGTVHSYASPEGDSPNTSLAPGGSPVAPAASGKASVPSSRDPMTLTSTPPS